MKSVDYVIRTRAGRPGLRVASLKVDGRIYFADGETNEIACKRVIQMAEREAPELCVAAFRARFDAQ